MFLTTLVGVVALPSAPAGASTSLEPGSVRRVLVVALPGVSWKDVDRLHLPNLDRLFRQSAVGVMTTRTIGLSSMASGYLTIGAGSRTAATELADDGAAFQVDERVGTSTAGEAYAQRRGHATNDEIVHLGIKALNDLNNGDRVDNRIGALGNALAKAGFDRAVVAGADGNQANDHLPRYRRYAVNALMTSDGRLPAGRIGGDLLTDHPGSPFGVRLDVDATVEAFRSVWNRRTVALVEGSDLARVAAFWPLMAPNQARAQLDDALRRTDLLVGGLLDEVDPAHDAVLVVGPSPSHTTGSMTLVSLRAPGLAPGLLSSATTRRAGYTLLADVAPTVLRLVGVDRPKVMSGRPFLVNKTSSHGAARRADLVEAIDKALFRASTRGALVITVTVLVGLLTLAAIPLLRDPARRRGRQLLRAAGLALVGLAPATYLAQLLPFNDAGGFAYAMFLVGCSAALAAISLWLGRGHVLDGPIIVLGVLAALLVVDIVLGASLQLDSAFGYSPAIGIRMTGLGNVSFALLAASTVILAGLVAERFPGPGGVRAAIAIMAVALVIDAAPFWGADVGGTLTLVPAFGVAAALLLGKRIRLTVRTVAIAAGAAIAALVVTTAIDLARPAANRTHLGRLVTQVHDQGLSKLVDVILKKADENLSTLTGSDWRFLPLVVLPFLAYLVFARPSPLARVLQRYPALRASLVGFLIATVLGYALNDSGIAIPAATLLIACPTLVALLTREPAPAEAQDVLR